MATQKEIMELERQFWQAMADMDIDAATSLLDDESVSVSGGGIHHFDPAGYKDMALAGTGRITAFRFSDERVIFPTPDVAIASYKANQTFTMDGKTHDMTVYDTTTWVRKNGKWVASAHTETPQHKSK